MVKIKSLILGLLTLVLLVSCVGGPRDISEKICELPPKTNSSLNSNNLEINVYVDGTPSMEGYVNQESTRYQKTLELLDRTFSLKSKKVNYNRLGTNKLNDRNSLKMHFNPNFIAETTSILVYR